MYYGGFTYSETLHLPVAKKQWFIQRIIREINKTHDEGQTRTRAVHQNDPQTREMLGMSRTSAPSRIRRFS